MTDGKHEAVEAVQTTFFSNSMYNFVKFVALILLPAVGTLYFALAEIWHWSNGEDVVGSITAVDAFLGAVVGFAVRSYNKSDSRFDGTINVVDTPDKKTYSLSFNSDDDVQNLDKKSEVTFKINTGIS
jgi:Putative phage holin Dp-1